MVIRPAVAVGDAETINFSYTIPCPHGQFMWAVNPRFLVLVSASQFYDVKNLIVMQKLVARTVGLKPT